MTALIQEHRLDSTRFLSYPVKLSPGEAECIAHWRKSYDMTRSCQRLQRWTTNAQNLAVMNTTRCKDTS